MSGAGRRSALRGHGSSLLVAGLGSAFGVALLQGTGVMAAAVQADAVTGASATVALLLQLTAVVFIVVAVYSSAVVTTNTFSTIVAGRVRSIALRRLLGSTAGAERRHIAREGLLVGAIGGVLGLVVGTGVVAAGRAALVATGHMDAFPYSFTRPVTLVPVVAVVLTTWGAAAVGSRRVLSVTPMQALGGAEEASEQEAGASRARTAGAVVLVSTGTALLVAGVAFGTVDPSGLLVAMAGGVVSFTGVVLGAHLVLPRTLRLVGRLFGTSPTARLAAENAVRSPMRATRSTVGLLVAVTLITTFGVATRTFQDLLVAAEHGDPRYYAGIDPIFSLVTNVFAALIGVSALIAAVGLVNALSLGVLQRTRELGLLRALGFSGAQLRRMVLTEAGQLVLTAVALGLLLGTAYGWAGAESMLGAVRSSPGLVPPGIPWALVAVIVVAGAALTLVASVAPARRATRIVPVEALLAD